MCVATEDQFDVTRIVQEHQETGSNPDPHDRLAIVRNALLNDVSEDIWRRNDTNIVSRYVSLACKYNRSAFEGIIQTF